MSTETAWKPTRRNFLVASCGLLVPLAGWADPVVRPVLAWSLDEQHEDEPRGNVGSRPNTVAATGRLRWTQDGKDIPLPRLDGYSVWFEKHLSPPVAMHRQLTLSAWIALESYPVHDASVMEWGPADKRVRLFIDRLGFANVWVGHDGPQAKSKHRVERGRWIHLAATLSSQGVLTLFVDGEPSAASETGSSGIDLPPIEHLFAGRSQDCELAEETFLTGVLNGLLREVRVYDVVLTTAGVRTLSHQFRKEVAPLELFGGWFEDDPQRPKYHAMPPRAWTNEPHGLVLWRGEYHLFYQKNSNGPYWGHIHWGHMTSPDLLHWTEQRVALTPEPGPDAEGCWSGSVIVDNGKLHLFYTGGDGKRATICMASTEDGVVFTKYAGNPVIEAPPEGLGVKEFRDPFVWREGAGYRMIVGSGIEGVGGTALLYRSDDLKSWHFLRSILTGRKQDSGVFWEMPVFIKVGDYHALVVCEVPGRASYWIGKWVNDEFLALTPEPQRLELINHFLSPTPCTLGDGRVVMIGILPDSREPKEAWRAGWAHLYGIPRELTLNRKMQLQQRPLREISVRFDTLLPEARPLQLGTEWTLIEFDGACGRLRVEFSRGDSETVTLALRRSPAGQEQTLLRYTWQSQILVVDRSASSLNPHVSRHIEQASYTPQEKDSIRFDIFLDQSVLEVFLDDRVCFGTRVYPVLPESIGVALRSEGGQGALARTSRQLFRSGRKPDQTASVKQKR